MAARKTTAKKSTARRAGTAPKSPAKTTARRAIGARKSSPASLRPIDIARRGYQAFAEGDVQWLNDHLSDGVVWHVPGRNPLSGDYRGKSEVLAFFARTIEMTGGTFRIELHDIVGNDDHVVGIGTQFAQGPGGEYFEGRFTQVFHIKNDKATEVWTHPEDSDAVDDFFSRINREEPILIPESVVVQEGVTIGS